MKTLKRYSAVTIVSIILTAFFVGCSGEEQTSFSLDEVTHTAIISGYVSYNEGQKYESGVFSENIKPATEKKIYVEINNSSFAPNGYSQGYTIFETKTDAAGNYEIEIPTVAKGNGVQVTVRAEDFQGTQLFVNSTEDGEPVFDKASVTFTSPLQAYYVKPNDFITADIRYTAKERDIEEGFTEKVNLKVKIGVGKLMENPRGVWYNPLPYFSFHAGIGAVVTASYETYKDGYSTVMERKYSITTDNQGEFTLQIPVKEKKGYLQIAMTVNSFKESAFYCPYDGDTYLFTGVYRQYYRNSFVQSVDYGYIYFDENQVGPLSIESRMVFDLDPNQQNSYYYSNNNFDWEGTSLNSVTE